MKKLSIIIIALLAILVCCKKTPEVNIKYVDIDREILTIGATSVNIQCDYEYIKTLKSAKLYYGQTDNGMKHVDMQVVQSVLYAEISGLTASTTYKYYYEFENGFNSMLSGVKTFTTEDNPTTVVLPTVITADVTTITAVSAVCGGEVTSDGGGTVTERGICWSLTNNPTLSNSHVAIGNGLGVFSATIDSLAANTTYHVRAYAINEAGTAYGLDKEFTTHEGGSSAELPTVVTSDVAEITTNSATCGGNVTSDGGADVVERGICWSTNANPTINDNHVASGSGMGSYTASMTGLASNTIYHVRAYATNEAGTAYGENKTFTTLEGGGTIVLPTVTTADVTEITSESAVSGGEVTSDGGGNVTSRGVCWSTSPNPTIEDSFTTDGNGIGSFVSDLTGLSSSTTYYVRAYATNEAGTAYGLDKEFTTLNSGGGGDAPTGAVNSLFTINDNGDQVYFSQGNLQYQASTDTWRFAEHQWDYVGGTMNGVNYGNVYENDVICNNELISPTYNGWIDLFGWGTSGWNNGNEFYHPYDHDALSTDVGYGYGPTDGTNYNYDLTGIYSNADWGVYNAISNGGNTPNLWRTLTQLEWDYVFNTRITTTGIRYAKAQVNNVNGVILTPDDWMSSSISLNNYNTYDASFSSNTLSASQWTVLEITGAVFLPATGRRVGISGPIYGCGCYWSASSYTNQQAYYVYFPNSYLNPNDTTGDKLYGQSVRLVQDANKK